MTDSGGAWDRIGRWGSTLFPVAAGVYVVAALTLGVEMFTTVAAEQIADVVAPAGFTVAFAALLALAPLLGDRSSWLVRILSVLAVTGALGMSVLAGANLVELLGLVDDRPTWVVALNLTRFFGIAGYLFAGVASLRAADRDRTLGALVVGVPVVDIAAFAAVGASGVQWVILASLMGQALLLLAISYSLRGKRLPTVPPESSTDAVR